MKCLSTQAQLFYFFIVRPTRTKGPTLFAVWSPIFQIERIVVKRGATVGAEEARGMKVLPNCVQAFVLDAPATFGAFRG